jgi:hypothetical protein
MPGGIVKSERTEIPSLSLLFCRASLNGRIWIVFETPCTKFPLRSNKAQTTRRR